MGRVEGPQARALPNTSYLPTRQTVVQCRGRVGWWVLVDPSDRQVVVEEEVDHHRNSTDLWVDQEVHVDRRVAVPVPV